MFPFLLIFISSLFFVGIINRVRSRLCGRQGPGIWQTLFDIWRLFQKSTIYSRDTSFIFQIAPTVSFASIICAILVVPFDSHAGFLSFEGDFIFFAYILATGKFFMILAALDTGSPFEGMGANREALYSMLVEPAFFILIGSLAMLTNHTSFYDIFNGLHADSSVSAFLVVLATYLIFQIALIENSRLPVDDPKTHLELTMVHEVMILDNSGFDLGLLLYGNSLKFAMYGLLIANFFHDLVIPANSFFTNLGAAWLAEIPKILLCLLVQVIFAAAVGFSESFRSRAPMRHNPQIIFTLTAIALLVFFSVLIISNKL